jgi:hypothetical protein
MKLKLKTNSSEAFKIFVNMNGGKVTYRAYFVRILEELLSKILLM